MTIDSVESVSPPYLLLERTGAGVAVSGLAECSLGHQLSRGGGAAPDGVFAHWKWDGRRLSAITDRYGMYPLYYSATGNSIAVSSSVATLLRHGVSDELDEAALAVYLRIGFFLGEDTPFQAIRAVPPNARFEWSGQGLEISTEEIRTERVTCSPEAAVDRYIELFRTAVRRRVPAEGRRIVPLSGGRDSRHVFFELCANDTPPDLGVTVKIGEIGECPEVAAAVRVAEACGVPHETIHGDKWSIGGEARKNELSNYCSDEHLWMLPLSDYLCRQTGIVVYDGIGGDVLSAGHRLDPRQSELYERGRLGELANLMADERERFLERLLSRDAYGRFNKDRATARLEEELRRHQDAVNPLTTFIFWNRTRREIALGPYALMAGVRTVYAPYLDHDLFDFLIGLPASYTIKKDFHNRTIAKTYPQWADLPYATAKLTPRYVHGAMRRSALELYRLIQSTGSSDVFKKWTLYGRLARCLVDPTYDWSAFWLGAATLYLIQVLKFNHPGQSLPAVPALANIPS